MGVKEDYDLALRVSSVIASQGYICAIEFLDTGDFTITYASDRPSIRVTHGKITAPKGSDYDLVMSLMGIKK